MASTVGPVKYIKPKKLSRPFLSFFLSFFLFCLFVCLFVGIKPKYSAVLGFWFLVCYAATQLATPHLSRDSISSAFEGPGKADFPGPPKL